MAENLSPVSHDKLKEQEQFTNESGLEEFRAFTSTPLEECKLLKENQRFLNESKKEIINLEVKLNNARKLLDQEKKRRIHAEEEKIKIERQLQLVRDCLLKDERNQIHNETKEKLEFLNSTNQGRMSNDAIQELVCTECPLSNLSYSRSHDDLEAVMQKKRTYRKHRPSIGLDELDILFMKRRCSHVVEVNKIDGLSEPMVATTTVTMEHDGALSAQSQIETNPMAVDYLPTAPTRCDFRESVESGLSIETNANINQETLHDVGVLPIDSNKDYITNHMFSSKTVIRRQDCDVCQKKIKFSHKAIQCKICWGSCHLSCKDNLPLPCIAPGSTPITEKHMGVLAGYAPSTQPMVSAIIQHCVKQIECRGLNEEGIYRVPGSAKEMHTLKEKFLRFRGVPRLTDIDIHVVCDFLKDFLRSLQEPLVTHALWWQFAKAAEIRDIEKKANIYQAVSQLPQPNRETLAFIVLHLLRVAESKETNGMPISNLSTVLGITLVGYPPQYDVNDTYTLTCKANLILKQLMMIPADYWSRVIKMPSSASQSTPHTSSACPQ